MKKHDISELDYIKFHFEVFMHKVHTICELMKLIANEVFNINLTPRDCTWNNLLKNKKFNSSKSKEIIQQYFDDFESLIEGRHLNTHRGIYSDNKMDSISITYNTYRYHDKLNIPMDKDYQKLFPYVFVKMDIQHLKKEKLKEMLVFEQQILIHASDFFNSLEPTK